MNRVACALLAVALLAVIGCGPDSNSHYITPVRKEQGLVIILPGIDGETENVHNIRRGLANAGCTRAMPIYNWGAPIPGVGLIINQTNVIGNRIAGANVAKMIEQYQDTYPGRPVHIVGHSGGGGVAVFAAEALSEGHRVDGLILLHASISAGYDLSKALDKVSVGIMNYYNPDDGLLSVGTVFMGNVDGAHDAGAGLNGFRNPAPRVRQVQVSATGGGGGHFGATSPYYVASHVAPWILSSQWEGQ
jgi:pimeloyl-ACP methyl ester carboxylesterase